MLKERTISNQLSLPADEILKDYRLAYQSRQASVIGPRRAVLSISILFQRPCLQKNIAQRMAVTVITGLCPMWNQSSMRCMK
jgi:hypothetical protein